MQAPPQQTLTIINPAYNKRLRPSMLSTAPRHRPNFEVIPCTCLPEQATDYKFWPPFMANCPRHAQMIELGAYSESLLVQCVRAIAHNFRELIWPGYTTWLPNGQWRRFDYIFEEVRPTNYPVGPLELHLVALKVEEAILAVSATKVFTFAESLHIFNYELGQFFYFAIAFWCKQWRWQAEAGPEDHALHSHSDPELLSRLFFNMPRAVGASYVQGGRSKHTILKTDPMCCKLGGSITVHSQMRTQLSELDMQIRLLDYTTAWRVAMKLIPTDMISSLEHGHAYPMQQSDRATADLMTGRLQAYFNMQASDPMCPHTLVSYHGIWQDLDRGYNSEGRLLLELRPLDAEGSEVMFLNTVMKSFKRFVAAYVCGPDPSELDPRDLALVATPFSSCGGLRYKPFSHRLDSMSANFHTARFRTNDATYDDDADAATFNETSSTASSYPAIRKSPFCELCMVDAYHGHRHPSVLSNTFQHTFFTDQATKRWKRLQALELPERQAKFPALKFLVEQFYDEIPSPYIRRTRFGRWAHTASEMCQSQMRDQVLMLKTGPPLYEIYDTRDLYGSKRTACWGRKLGVYGKDVPMDVSDN